MCKGQRREERAPQSEECFLELRTMALRGMSRQSGHIPADGTDPLVLLVLCVGIHVVGLRSRGDLEAVTIGSQRKGGKYGLLILSSADFTVRQSERSMKPWCFVWTVEGILERHTEGEVEKYNLSSTSRKNLFLHSLIQVPRGNETYSRVPISDNEPYFSWSNNQSNQLSFHYKPLNRQMALFRLETIGQVALQTIAYLKLKLSRTDLAKNRITCTIEIFYKLCLKKPRFYSRSLCHT